MRPVFLKQGKASCGVARQYTGSAGKITNCQIGLFASYVSRRGHAFIDRALHLPKEWTDDPARLKAAHVPSDVGLATKPKIARRLIARAITVKVPFSFVAADCMYGTGEIETLLRKAGKGYVLGVASNHVFHSWGKQQPVAGTASAIARSLPKKTWRRLPSGEGTKGPRRHDWAYLELADLEASEYNDDLAGEWTRGLLIRRNIADGSLAFFSTWCPKGTSMHKLVSVEGHRWAIEDSFETAKNELGLDHNETRSWHGWHRHVPLVMLALAMMAIIRHRANAEPALKKTPPRRRTKHRYWECGHGNRTYAYVECTARSGRQRFTDQCRLRSRKRHRTRNGPAFGERGDVNVFWPSAERAQHGRRLVYTDRRMADCIQRALFLKQSVSRN
jgi:SRSO17 transposase